MGCSVMGCSVMERPVMVLPGAMLVVAGCNHCGGPLVLVRRNRYAVE